MNKKRLLKLADFLEAVPRKAFNMSEWRTRKPTKPEGDQEGSCGFAGCAMGWATHAKLFRGLHFGRDAVFSQSAALVYKDFRNWEVPVALFGIERPLAVELFDADFYPAPPTPKQVAKLIRKFVETGSIW